MRHLSVCSGIEAASVAAEPLGWQPVAFSEIDAFPAAVLAHRFPGVPNWGDMTSFQEWPDAAVDLLVGGTPCQSFSFAGLRKGLADPRGNLMLTYLAIAARYRPDWLVWENVPGVLSSNKGRDFGSFLGSLGKLGYGFAYRVLDAQYVRTRRFSRAVPQRRRRVFVVGYLGDWRRAAAVLFDAESLQRHSAPRREAGQNVAPCLAERTRGGGGLGTDFDCDGGLIPEVCPTLSESGGNARPGDNLQSAGIVDNGGHDRRVIGRAIDPGFGVCGTLSDGAHMGGGLNGQDAYTGRVLPVAFSCKDHGAALYVPGHANALTSHNGQRNEVSDMVNGLVAFSCKDHGADAAPGVSPTLRAMGHGQSHANSGGQLAVAFDLNQITSKTNRSRPDSAVHHTLPATSRPPHLASIAAVRRLTPVECERLQGFPDGWTAIPWRGRAPEDCPDGPRYKALGNSMAVNCMDWIFQRIDLVNSMEVSA